MLVHFASSLAMQQLCKNPNYVCFDAYKAKYVHTAIHDLKHCSLQGFIEIACFPYGQLPSVDVDKHHAGCPSKLAY